MLNIFHKHPSPGISIRSASKKAMDQRDSCISSPALNELSKRLSDETDRLKYARVIYLSQSVGQRIDAIRKELQAPREYNKRQMRELVLDRNKCIHHSLMVTTSIGATKKRQHGKCHQVLPSGFFCN